MKTRDGFYFILMNDPLVVDDWHWHTPHIWRYMCLQCLYCVVHTHILLYYYYNILLYDIINESWFFHQKRSATTDGFFINCKYNIITMHIIYNIIICNHTYYIREITRRLYIHGYMYTIRMHRNLILYVMHTTLSVILLLSPPWRRLIAFFTVVKH